jgi:hypothetical protein
MSADHLALFKLFEERKKFNAISIDPIWRECVQKFVHSSSCGLWIVNETRSRFRIELGSKCNKCDSCKVQVRLTVWLLPTAV